MDLCLYRFNNNVVLIFQYHGANGSLIQSLTNRCWIIDLSQWSHRTLDFSTCCIVGQNVFSLLIGTISSSSVISIRFSSLVISIVRRSVVVMHI